MRILLRGSPYIAGDHRTLWERLRILLRGSPYIAGDRRTLWERLRILLRGSPYIAGDRRTSWERAWILLWGSFSIAGCRGALWKCCEIMWKGRPILSRGSSYLSRVMAVKKNCPDPGGGTNKPYITEYSVCVGANTSVQEQDLTKTSTNDDDERQKDHKSPSEIPTRLVEILMFHILGL